MYKISVICPVCNEKDNLDELVNRIHNTLAEHFICNNAELILVDDGSTDGSNKIISDLTQRLSNIRFIVHDKKRGQAAALCSGFKVAKGDIIITLDSDLQVFPEDLPILLNKISGGYQLVNGVRSDRKEVLLLRLSSKLFSLLVSILINTRIKDAASSFTAIRKEFVNNLSLVGNDHRYIIPIVKKRGAVRIAEVMVRHTNRRKGKSKYKLSKVILAVPEFFSFWLRFTKGYYDSV